MIVLLIIVVCLVCINIILTMINLQTTLSLKKELLDEFKPGPEIIRLQDYKKVKINRSDDPDFDNSN